MSVCPLSEEFPVQIQVLIQPMKYIRIAMKDKFFESVEAPTYSMPSVKVSVIWAWLPSPGSSV